MGQLFLYNSNCKFTFTDSVNFTKLVEYIVIMRFILCWIFLLGFSSCQGDSKGAASANSCFCKLSGVLDDCPCTAVTIDQYNTQLHPNLIKLLETDYFRYFEVDFSAPCKYGWDAQCSSPNCAVDTCQEEDLPEGVQNESRKKFSWSTDGYFSRFIKKILELFPFLEPYCLMVLEVFSSYNLMSPRQPCNSVDPYPEHHDVVKGEQFCKLDPLDNPDKCSFVDLLQNPEKFTGYSGEAAHRVWIPWTIRTSAHLLTCYKTPRSSQDTVEKLPTGCGSPGQSGQVLIC